MAKKKVQCIYIDPPYGINFRSNFQWSTTTTKVDDGRPEHLSREPEQVKAFRDTWREGIHSYLAEEADDAYGGRQQDFATVILDNLKTAGVQQAHKEDRIVFDSLTPIAGDYVCAEGTYTEGDAFDAPQRRAGIFLGPEFGTVSHPPRPARREGGGI